MKRFICIAFVIILIFSSAACTVVENDISSYDKNVKQYYASSFMPSLDKIGNYQDISYTLIKNERIFATYSLKLIVKYNQQVFQQEKERLNNAYTYINEPQFDQYGSGFYTIPIAEFSDGKYNFKITKFEDTTYPKNFGLVGISDETFEIAYLWLYDQDLDFICDKNSNEIKQMNEFLEYYFKWK